MIVSTWIVRFFQKQAWSEQEFGATIVLCIRMFLCLYVFEFLYVLWMDGVIKSKKETLQVKTLGNQSKAISPYFSGFMTFT
jgi:hypothetical protein